MSHSSAQNRQILRRRAELLRLRYMRNGQDKNQLEILLLRDLLEVRQVRNARRLHEAIRGLQRRFQSGQREN